MKKFMTAIICAASFISFAQGVDDSFGGGSQDDSTEEVRAPITPLALGSLPSADWDVWGLRVFLTGSSRTFYRVNGINLGLADFSYRGRAGFSKFNRTGTDFVNGFELGLLRSKASEVNGFDLALLTSYCERMNGLQFSIYNECDVLNGVQIALGNMTSDMNGLALGLANVADCAHGVQIGIINAATSGCCLQIGLLNLDCNSESRSVLPIFNFVMGD